MTIKHIIFDLDGTLINSVPDIATALNHTLSLFNIPSVEESRVKNWVGKGIDTLLDYAIEDAGTDQSIKEEALNTIKKKYLECCTEKTHLYANVIETLSLLREKQIELTIATNKPSAMISPILRKLQIDSFFSLHIGGDEVTNKKPHPEMLHKCMETLGFNSVQTLMVGDSSNDILAAKSANIPVAALTYGYNHGQPIEDKNPDFILNSFDEIMKIIP